MYLFYLDNTTIKVFKDAFFKLTSSVTFKAYLWLIEITLTNDTTFFWYVYHYYNHVQ